VISKNYLGAISLVAAWECRPTALEKYREVSLAAFFVRLVPSGMRQRPHRPQSTPNFLLSYFQIISRLQIEPVLRRLPEGATNEKRKLCRNRPRAIDDMGNPHGRNPDDAGEFAPG